MYSEPTYEAERLAKLGIIYVIPYYNPWAWMNKNTIEFVDKIIDILIEEYNLVQSIPLTYTGDSMGGHGALTYSMYAKRKPVACIVNCPVCDLVYHYSERNDLPRTMYSAFYNEDGNIEDILAKYSPMHNIDKLPKCNYYFFTCENDGCVNKDKHSEKLISKMKENYNITYNMVPNRDHCCLSYEYSKLYQEYLTKDILE